MEQIRADAAVAAAEKAKKEAAETAAKEKAAKRTELSGKLEAAQAELATGEKGAEEARTELAALTTGETEFADNPEVLADIKVQKAEHAGIIEAFEAKKKEVADIQVELAKLEGGEAEAVAEEPKETEASVEAPKEKVETPEAKLDSMSYKEATAFINGEFDNPAAVKDVEEWYQKILSGSGTVSDVAFANSQREKLKSVPGRLAKLGDMALQRMQKEGETTEEIKNAEKGIADMISDIEVRINNLSVKIEDRTMLASEASEQEVGKKIHFETLKEDIDLVRNQYKLHKKELDTLLRKRRPWTKEDFSMLRRATRVLRDDSDKMVRTKKDIIFNVSRENPDEKRINELEKGVNDDVEEARNIYEHVNETYERTEGW